MNWERRSLIVRLLAWTGLLGPAAIILTRAAEDVAESPLAAISLLRGLAPGVLLLITWAIARSPLHPVNVRERWLIAYLGVAIASTLWSIAPMATFLKAGHLVVAFGMLVLLSREWQDREQALDELAVVGFAIVLIAVLGAGLWPEEALWQAWPGAPRRLRTVVPALHPVTLGLISAVAVVMCVGGRGPRLIRENPMIRVLLSLASLAVLLLTRSRAPLGLLVISLGVFFWVRVRRRVMIVAMSVAVTTVAVVVVSAAGDAFVRWLARGQSAEGLATLNGRVVQWGDAVDVWIERPLTGYGHYAGHRFGPYADVAAARTGNEALAILDGTWIATLLELGPAGVITLFGLVLVCALRIVQELRRRNTDAAAATHAVLLGMLLGFSIMDSTLDQVQYSLVVFGSLLLMPASMREDGVNRRNAP